MVNLTEYGIKKLGLKFINMPRIGCKDCCLYEMRTDGKRVCDIDEVLVHCSTDTHNRVVANPNNIDLSIIKDYIQEELIKEIIEEAHE